MLRFLLLTSLITVVPAKKPISQHIMFVVDTSGSMKGDKFVKAIKAVVKISEQPTDELQIAAIAFTGTTSRWKGLPEKGVPQGWAQLPSMIAVQKAESFLVGRGAQGDTLVTPALKLALSERRKDLTIVLVTDGDFFGESDESILKMVKERQSWRVKQGLGKANIWVYGVGVERKILSSLAKTGDGGYYRESVVGPPLLPR